MFPFSSHSAILCIFCLFAFFRLNLRPLFILYTFVCNNIQLLHSTYVSYIVLSLYLYFFSINLCIWSFGYGCHCLLLFRCCIFWSNNVWEYYSNFCYNVVYHVLPKFILHHSIFFCFIFVVIDFVFFFILFFFLFYSLPVYENFSNFFPSIQCGLSGIRDMNSYINLLRELSLFYLLESSRNKYFVARDDWKNIHFSLAQFICWIPYVSNLTRKFRNNSVHCIQFFPLTISSFFFLFLIHL